MALFHRHVKRCRRVVFPDDKPVLVLGIEEGKVNHLRMSTSFRNVSPGFSVWLTDSPPKLTGLPDPAPRSRRHRR
jgi:hypothetical protein